MHPFCAQQRPHEEHTSHSALAWTCRDVLVTSYFDLSGRKDLRPAISRLLHPPIYVFINFDRVPRSYKTRFSIPSDFILALPPTSPFYSHSTFFPSLHLQMCDSSNTKSQKLSNQEHVARFNKYIEGFPQSSPKSWSDQPSFSSRNLSHSATSTALLSSNPTLSQFNMPQTGKHPEPVAPLDTNLDLNSLPVEPEDPPRFANSIPQFFREIRALFPLNDGGHLEHRNDPPSMSSWLFLYVFTHVLIAIDTSSHSQPQSGNQRFEGGAIQASSGTHTQGLHMKHVKDDSFPIPTKKHIILG